MHQLPQVGSNMMASVGGVPNHSNNVNRRNRVRVTLHAMMLKKLPLHEAACLEMKSLPSKTPVSVLKELLSRRGTIPKYELVQIEGAIHEPTFRYRVTVTDVVDPIVSAMGTGRSKKEAKHAAAKAMLDKLMGVNTEGVESPLPNSFPDSQNLQELQTYGEEKIVNNPIGALQEMCMSRHWPPPKYTMEGEEGLPHERQFTIVCSILKYREVGQGKSKKVAKRHAAHKMWQAVHDMNNQALKINDTTFLYRPSTSSLADNGMDSSAERQSQDTSGLPVQSFKETTEKTGAFNEPSTSITTGFDTNPTAECQSQETVDLDPQTCEQSKKETRARIGTVMTSKKKWSTLWNYFEELKPSLVKCTTCKKEIKIPRPKHRTNIMRVHLFKQHGISLDDNTLTLPEDLRQYYSVLPGFKAKCKNCGKTVSFLTNMATLRVHLRKRHSIKIQSRNKKASKKKRSKLWNYFEELKPSLVKCTTCKKEIKMPDPTRHTKIMRAHLFNVHGISLDDDTLTLLDDLKQYYSELPGYKAKCKDCGKTVSFLTNITHLRKHLRRHSIKTQNRVKPSTSSLVDNGMDPSAERQSQDTSGLPVQSFKETTEKTGAFNEPSTSITTGFDTNPTAECQSQETVDLDPQTCEQSKKETRARIGTVIMAPKRKRKLWNYFEQLKPSLVKCTICKKEITIPQPTRRSKIFRAHLLIRHGIFLDNDTLPADLRQYYSELSGHKAKCNDCGKTKSFLTNIARLRKHLRRHSTRILNRDEPSTSSLADNTMDPSAERQSQDTSGLPVQSFKEKTGAFNVSSTSSLTGHDMDPNLERQIQEIVDFVLRSEQSRKETRALDGPNTSISMGYDTNSAAEFQIQESPGLPVQLFGQTRKEISAFDKPSTSSSADYSMDPTAERQSGELSGLPVQSLKEMAEETGALDKPSTSSLADYSVDPSAECQSQDNTSGLPIQSFKETTEKTGALNESSTSSLADNGMDPSAERQSQDTSGLLVQSFKETTEKTGALKEPSTSIIMGFDTNSTADCQSQETVDLDSQMCEQSRKETRARNRTVMTSKKKWSTLWNYFEELKPSLVKCTTCKKEIKISGLSNRIKIIRAHLFNVHGISLDDDTLTLPDNLKQYYSKLPGYKAKCKDCGKTVSFLTKMATLRVHLRKRHSIKIQSRNKKASRRKRSKLWNYFEELKPSLVKCTTCKKEIKVLTTQRIRIIRAHLFNVHGISLDDDTFTLPADLRQYYSVLPGFKAKCKNCGKTVSFLTKTAHLRQHLRIHFTRILNRDEKVTASTRKRSKLWNYFEELKPSLVKCTTCKKEIKIPRPNVCTRIMRVHLLKKHGISLDDDTLTLPEDLRQYYSVLPGFKAKCKNCGKTVSFVTNIQNLLHHLRIHSTRIQIRDKPSTSSLADNTMDPSAERQSQDTSGLPVKSFKEKTGAFNVSSTSSSTGHDMDPNLERQIQEIIDFVLRSEQSRKETRALDGPNTSISMGYDTNPAAECQIQESPGLPVQLFGQTKKEISALDKPSTSSSADYSMDPTAERQSGELSGLPVQSLKEMAEETGALDKPSTSSLADYSVDPSAERQSQDTSSLPVQSFKETVVETGELNEPSTSIIMGFDTNSTAECQNQDSPELPVQSFKQTRKETSSLDKPSISSSADYSMDPTAERQSEELSGLPVQSFKETTERTGTLDDTSSSMDYNTNPAAECQSQEIVDLDPQTCEQSRKGTRARDGSVIIAPKKERSKLWNYFEELKSVLVKCAICKIEIHMPHPSNSTAIMIEHLNKHGIFFNNDTFTLFDDLRKYYSELPGYKAKCNDCSKTMPFLANILRLRKHLRRHSTRILSRDEPSTSSLADNGMDLSAECQSQDNTSGLPSQSFKETTEKTGALNDRSTSTSTCCVMDRSAECQSQDTSGLSDQSFKETTGKTSAHNESGTSSLADNGMDPSAERQSQDTSGLLVKSFKETTEKTFALKESSTSISTGYNIGVTNPTADCQSQETVDLDSQMCEQSRKETRARDRIIIMAPRRERSKLWNYFEELKPSMVKCTTCKKEIKIPRPTYRISIMRVHLLKEHGISLDDDTLRLPEDLRQYYSELPGFKAKCKNCGKTVSFLTNIAHLRQHLRIHSTRILNRDEKVTASTRKRSKLWNYFEELKPSLVKCTTCKEKIKIPRPKHRTNIMRVHLFKKHGISLDDNTLTLPEDLRQYYSELPGFKAKCKNCGKTVSFLTNFAHLRQHLRIHSTRILNRDEKVTASTRKRSKLWNYFEELKPSLVKCTTCKEKIKTRHLTNRTNIMRVHLFKKHGISLDDNTLTLPEDLRQYYSVLPGFKAKCESCGKTVSFLTNMPNLRIHLRIHSTRIQIRDKPSTSSLADNTMDPSAERQSQDTSGLPVQSFKEKTGAFNVSSTSSSTGHDMDPNLERQIQEIIDFVLRSEQSRKETRALDGPNTSISMGYDTNPAAECQIQESPGLPVQLFGQTKKEISALDKPSTSSSADYSMDPTAERQSGELSGLPVQSLKEMAEETGALDKPSTSSLADYSVDPSAECQSQDNTSGLPSQSFKETTEKTGALNESVIMAPKKIRSKLWDYFEELKYLLVKCAICKIQIHMLHPSNSTAIMIGHLNRHGIFFNNNTFTLPDDLRKYYSELPGYKAKCNDCSKTMPFLTDIIRLRKHLIRHSTRILSRDVGAERSRV
ncbi:uncharacterized protein [Temnothorax nylanderi]|uniref:uncharacterized protein n=1 Tax=Temnothorax nylanderi TaxID=102681 RepID=UPI003A86597E